MGRTRLNSADERPAGLGEQLVLRAPAATEGNQHQLPDPGVEIAGEPPGEIVGPAPSRPRSPDNRPAARPARTAGLREDLERLDDSYGTAVSVRTVYGRSAPPPDALHPLPDPGNLPATDLGARAGHFVLVRPDGYVCGKGRFGDARQMEHTLRRAHPLPAKGTR